MTKTFFACSVTYGTGAVPTEVSTAFDSRTVILSGLPNDTQEDNIASLCAPYGDVESMNLDYSGPLAAAEVTYNERGQANRAARLLNGTDFRLGSEHQSYGLSTKLAAKAPTRFGNPHGSRQVKLTWSLPTRVAWGFYTSIGQAKEAVTRLDQTQCDNRKVSPSLLNHPFDPV